MQRLIGIAITPRNGKAVEINALWYNALKVLENLAKEFKDLEKEIQCNDYARRCKISFREVFVSKKGGLKDLANDDKIRPNQLFALALSHNVIDDPDIIEDIIMVVEKKLLNKYGLKTLAKDEKRIYRRICR